MTRADTCPDCGRSDGFCDREYMVDHPPIKRQPTPRTLADIAAWLKAKRATSKR